LVCRHLAYALWRRTTGKPLVHHRASSMHLSRTCSTRSHAATPAPSSQRSFRFEKSDEMSDRMSRVSVTTQISVLSQLKQHRHHHPASDSSNESDPFVSAAARSVPGLRRSMSAKNNVSGVVPRNYDALRNSGKSNSCRNTSRFTVGCKRSLSTRSLKRGSPIVLPSGDVVSRNHISISTPFNAEAKLSWEWSWNCFYAETKAPLERMN